jgi:hypothetical protein
MLDTGCWILDTGYWMVDGGWWIWNVVRRGLRGHGSWAMGFIEFVGFKREIADSDFFNFRHF